MADMIFNTYAEAASYAKRRAQESGLSVKLERRNEEWVVFDLGYSSQPDYQTTPSPQHGGVERHDVGEQRQKEREQEQKAVDSWKMQKAQHAPCYACGGRGEGNDRTCKRCLGRGYI